MQARFLYFFYFDSACVFALYVFAYLDQTLLCIDVKNTKGSASVVCRADTLLWDLDVIGSHWQVR